MNSRFNFHTIIFWTTVVLHFDVAATTTTTDNRRCFINDVSLY